MLFYFILKALFVLQILKFLSRRFGHTGKTLDQKDKVNFKIHDVTSWLTTVIHKLSNISQSKGNQTAKFDQLIEYNKRNIVLQKLCAK